MPAAATVPSQNMQGILVPASSVDPAAFFRATRRLTFLEKTTAYAGLGSTDTISVLQTGIIAGLNIRFSGTLTVTPGTGTVASTARWPYDLIRALRFSANGQSNLINCSGWKLKARDFIALSDLTDRGVSQGIGGASPGTSRNNGTLSLNCESWGVGQNVTAIASGTPAVELEWFVPVAFDQVTLLGAIFAQTSSTDLVVGIDWAPLTDLFVLTGNATVTLAGTLTIEAIVYSIPQGPDGNVIVPDLSAFHSLISARYTAVGNGDNEIRLAGQGVGRQLMRLFWQTWNGSPSTPLAVNATNYGPSGWRYGGNDTPERFQDGQTIRELNERLYGMDIGAFAGFGAIDFANQNAFRDSVDEGSATDLRLLLNIPNGVTLSTPAVEYVQETIFAGAVGA